MRFNDDEPVFEYDYVSLFLAGLTVVATLVAAIIIFSVLLFAEDSEMYFPGDPMVKDVTIHIED